jgi:hypothetical protein
MSALPPFGSPGSARRKEAAELRAALMANPDVMEAVDRVVREILRVMPDYDVEKSFLARWASGAEG